MAPCVVCAQRLHGTVVDKQTGEKVKGAIIRSSLGTTTSGLTGQFIIPAEAGDTLIVYKHGYQSFRLPVSQINGDFTIQLSKSSILLKEVVISTRRDDRKDSLANRQEFDKEFNYKPPAVKDIFMGSAPRSKSTLVSLNLGMLYSLITKKKSKEYRLKQKLLSDEQERFVDRKFNAAVVGGVTGLKGTELNEFLWHYRPSYKFVKTKSSYDLVLYIKESYKSYKEKR